MRAITFGLVITLVFSACQKEVEPQSDNPQQNNTNCSLTKQYLIDQSGQHYDSAIYVYTNKLVSKVTYATSDEFYTITYNNNKISRIQFFDALDPNPFEEKLFSYNSDGTLKCIEDYTMWSGSLLSRSDSLHFYYGGSKVQKVTQYFVGAPPALPKVVEFEYHYTGNNITKSISQSFMSGVAAQRDSVLLSYDSKPNLFRKNFGQAFWTDAYLADIGMDLFAIYLSENNLTQTTFPGQPSSNETISYVTDTNGNLSIIKSNNQAFIRYSYLCQ